MTHVVLISAKGQCFDPREDYRCFTDEAFDWLEQHVGPQAYELEEVSQHAGWCAGYYSYGDMVGIHFHDHKLAMLFKLTWGGSN